MQVRKVGVVGAGFMGTGITQVVLEAGLPVVLKDVAEPMLQRGMQALTETYQRRVDRGRMSVDEMRDRLARVTPTLDYDQFSDIDLVIETVPEAMAIKAQVLADLDQVCPKTTVLASNTSALAISALGAASRRPDRMIGLHFFSPAHVMRLVEVIPGLDTAAETTALTVAFAETLQKTPVIVRECPGFLVNRLLVPYLNEATFALQEGAANAAEIDAIMADFGWPMGPFRLMDMLGIDVILHIAVHLDRAYGMGLPVLYETLVQAGRLGQKSGTGFYSYESSGAEPLEALLQRLGTAFPALQPQFTWQRPVMAMINEAVRGLTEGIAQAESIDLAMVLGTGMKHGATPTGPLHLADQIGLDTVLSTLRTFQQQHGDRFRPAYLLDTMVSAGHLGVKAGRGFFSYPS